MKKKLEEILKNDIILKILIYAIFFIVYIFPTGLINSNIPLDKLMFMIVTSGVYIYYLIIKKKIEKEDIFFLLAIVIFNILGKTINYFLFLPILLVKDLLKEKDKILEIIEKSNILYICLFFTILYSIINFKAGGRYAFSAIIEINQSGLAIFCLALLLIKKSKKIGYATLFFGLLTISRSYYLAVIIYIISKFPITKKILSKLQNKLKYLNYMNITVISSTFLILVAYIYLNKYANGEIFWGDNISNRLINIFDYSNFYRFIANIAVIMILTKNPSKIFTGLTKDEYISMGTYVYENLDVPYKYTNPHNLFFSHLKMYGAFVILEIIYISKILQKIINKNNFMIYMAIVSYSVILGAGLYSYWLYLSVFVFIAYEREDDISENSINR